jgi:aldehyde dehydrogenase (NAD+)
MEFPFSTSNLPLKMFINNEYMETKNSEKFILLNPKDGSLVSDRVPVAGPEDVDLAVDCAQKAFPAWRKVEPSERCKMMLKFADLLEQYSEKLGDLTRLTLGSTRAFGRFESSMAAQGLRYNAGWIDKFAGETYPQDDGFLKIVRNEPLGVTAGIVPWNGPLITVGLKAAPALATGNCFIFKPSEKTPFASLALGPLIKEAGFPPGVFQVLPGDGSTGAILSSHMGIRKISFTGSCATGKKIQEMAAKSNLKRVTLELGGKSPAVIFNDCDIDNAVKWTVNSVTTASGQVGYSLYYTHFTCFWLLKPLP